MVSFWPWASGNSSTSEFEKVLSTLSDKIAKTQVALDSTRTRARKFKILTVLYLTFAYLVYVIVAFLVVGSRKMGSMEWTGVSGAPILIYLIRRMISTFYDYRIESLSTRLKELQSEREKTIQKLKDATKYNSTLELIEKYGGVTSSTEKLFQTVESNNALSKTEPRNSQNQVIHRTGIPPPATANIQQYSHSQPSQKETPRPSCEPQALEPSEEFAPNAFQPGQLPYAPSCPSGHQRTESTLSISENYWYDRILDLLLGEDEKDPKNRIVLICQKCRVVNGQAPPGVKSLAEIGIWKCGTCGASNGQDESEEIIQKLLNIKKDDASFDVQLEVAT